MNGESGLRAGPATPGGRRGASRPRDPSGDDPGVRGPGRWAWGSPLLQGGRQFLPSPLPHCVSYWVGSRADGRDLGL